MSTTNDNVTHSNEKDAAADTLRIKLQPAAMPEWEAEDDIAGVLGDDAPAFADASTAQEMLDKTDISLPRLLDTTDLLKYAHKSSAGIDIPADTEAFDFHLCEIPVTLIVNAGQRLVRLRVELTFSVEGAPSAQIVAYDLFPTTQTDCRQIMSGEAGLDVSAMLQFLLTATGAAPMAPLAKALQLKVSLPFKWTSTVATVQSSARMNNPVSWYVRDRAILNGFSPAVIVRRRIDARRITAELAVEKLVEGAVPSVRPADVRDWLSAAPTRP